MSEQLINLSDYGFWFMFLAAIFMVSPLSNFRYKAIVWCILNCSFVLLILHWHGFIMLGIVFIGYLILQGVSGRHQKVSTVIAGLSILIMFLIHKTPLLPALAPLSSVRTVLTVCGFSYIALRLVEVTRAVYEKRHPPPNLIVCINYLIPFHMLAAGPIQSYDAYINQPLTMPSSSMQGTLEGVERIVFGLFKKFVLAYIISQAFLTGFTSNGIYFFIEVQFFFLWLYLDFSAYSDIAVGIGRLLGVPTPENFNRPYLSRNMTDFWERWHITLSQFIFRNIFIPLQLFLNRRDQGSHPLRSASIAFTIAFLLCGLWHGISVNFLLWGGIHALGLVATNLYKNLLKKRLGKQGLKKYMSNRFIRYFMQVVTYEYVAFSLVALFYP